VDSFNLRVSRKVGWSDLSILGQRKRVGLVWYWGAWLMRCFNFCDSQRCGWWIHNGAADELLYLLFLFNVRDLIATRNEGPEPHTLLDRLSCSSQLVYYTLCIQPPARKSRTRLYSRRLDKRGWLCWKERGENMSKSLETATTLLSKTSSAPPLPLKSPVSKHLSFTVRGNV
jgi:hypothetical protein